MARFYSDLHCHSALFSYNHFAETAWTEEHQFFYHSQGDFAKLGRGKVRLVVVSLYPIEQGFVVVKPLNLGESALTEILAEIVFSLPVKRTEEIQHYDHDYFDDLLKEVEFIASTQEPVSFWNRSAPGKDAVYKYRIVKDFEDLHRLLELDETLQPCTSGEDKIAVVLSVEGAHCLGIGQKNTLYKDETFLAKKLSENISRLKKLGPPGGEGDWCPFYITLTHHFWNQLGGHSVTFSNIINKVLDQTTGLSKGVTPLGQMVVEQLLNTEQGQKRILIDISHMSHRMRRWYFRYLSSRGDHIPIIASHTGVNGKRTMSEAVIKTTKGNYHEIADELYRTSTSFNPWDLLLSDEEIMIIHRSGGIIGINLEHRIMMGTEKLNERKHKARSKTLKEQQEIWIRPFIDQVLHIAAVILKGTGNPSGIWDNICIGSDYGGMITPIAAFPSAEKFPEFDEALFSGIKRLVDSEELLIGKTDEEMREITDMVMWKNLVTFLRRNF